LRFPRTRRLTATRQFRAVYDGGRRVFSGPLAVWGRRNGLQHCRLGLAVPRHVGNAVTRNRIRRRLRESFRLIQHELPAGYDLVINVRRHEPLPGEEYREALKRAAKKLDEK
jgi:ribonuclease P protein component